MREIRTSGSMSGNANWHFHQLRRANPKHSQLRSSLFVSDPMPRLIDLSHPLEHGQPNFPFDPKLSVLVHNTVASIGYNITQISMSTHQGTHLDAPYHFYDDGKTVDQMPLDRFYGPAVLVDLAPGAFLPAKTTITREMLEPHAEKFQPGAKVIYRTGWDRTFGTPECFTEFPTLTLEAARWIADRCIGLRGIMVYCCSCLAGEAQNIGRSSQVVQMMWDV